MTGILGERHLQHKLRHSSAMIVPMPIRISRVFLRVALATALISLAACGPTAVVRPDHPLAKKSSVKWKDLASRPIVLPPPHASLRAKIDRLFVRSSGHAPDDVIETASFLATLTFVRERQAAGFMARSVAQHFERQGLLAILPLKVALPLPPVGIITLRGRPWTPTSERMIESLRRASRK